MSSRRLLFRFGEFELDERRGELQYRGENVPIQAKPLELLSVLLRNPDRVVPKDELIDAVWSDIAVSDASLATALRQVRHILDRSGSEESRVATLRGRGFRLRCRADCRRRLP